MSKVAVISGVTGMDGAYLAEFLLQRGYTVHGLVRRSSVSKLDRLQHLLPHARLQLHSADMCDFSSISQVLAAARPDEVYNLAAQSYVQASWAQPIATAQFTAVSVTCMLEAARQHCPECRFYQASTSELFGKVQTMPQNEQTPFYPRSPYGVAKLYGHWITINYRESYGMHASCGILYNHEGPTRGTEFVTRKITQAAARIKHGLQTELRLGNLQSARDWGFYMDFVNAMWMILQQPEPDDYVIATGEMHTVQEFVEAAFAEVDLDWRKYVIEDSALLRPAEVDVLCGDATKARERLGWAPTVSFAELVRRMVHSDMRLASMELHQEHLALATF